MIGAEKVLRSALIAALRAAPSLRAVVTADQIFDRPPDGVAVPYIALSGGGRLQFLTSEQNCIECSLIIEIWTDGESRQTLWSLGQAVQAIIDAGIVGAPDAEFTLSSTALTGIRTDRVLHTRLLVARVSVTAILDAAADVPEQPA